MDNRSGMVPSGITKPKSVVILIICLMLLSLIPSVDAQQSNTVSIIDGRIVGFLSQADQVHSVNTTVDAGQWLSVTVKCGQCTATISIAEQNISTTNTAVIQVTESGLATLEIVSDISEMVMYTFTDVISEDYPTVRPAPSQTIVLDSGGVCDSQFSCID